ncbi:Cell division protein FtsH [Lachnospiraceae bacterium TWA4]|nr:Cell division protein FtsH [Lachnospiraceae bacterium TWA4]
MNELITKCKDFIKEYWKYCLVALAIVIVALGVFGYKQFKKSQQETVVYAEFYKQAMTKKVDRIDYTAGADTFTYQLKDSDKVYKTDNPKSEDFKKEMLLFGIENFKEHSKIPFSQIFGMLINVLMVGAFMMIVFSMGILSGGENTLVKTPTTTFKDVAGMDEVKEELKTLQKILEQSDLCGEYGIRVPKGVLLEGPPGNGKTFLAKAFAGESGLNYFATNASQFGNVYAGLGANQIEKLFKTAKEKAPSVIFIDELDSIGAKRNGDGSAAGRDNTKTLTALLSAMDGFSPEDHVIVIAATNRADDLDEALVRPGRFDKQFHISLPDKKMREQLVRLNLKDKKLADDVSEDWIVAETSGNSCAAIESIINEAALLAVQEKKDQIVITREMIETAIIKMEIKGHVKKESSPNEQVRQITAYHEAGHTVATALLTTQELTRVTILPSTSGVGGYTKAIPKEHELYTQEQVAHEIMVLYAGRQSELEFNQGNTKEVTIGCSNDIQVATSMLKNCLNFTDLMDHGPIVDYSQYGLSGEKQSLKLAENVSSHLINETTRFVKDHWAEITAVANALLEKETLQGSEVLEILNSFKTLDTL